MISKALIVVDVQNDFCEGGTLACDGGATVASKITSFIEDNLLDYDIVVATQDFHYEPGDHFIEWPPHCIAETSGAQFHENFHVELVDSIFQKGLTSAAYSGFEGLNEELKTLRYWLDQRGIKLVEICGIATDYCVKATALDAMRFGYKTRVIEELCVPTNQQAGDRAIQELKEAGVIIL